MNTHPEALRLADELDVGDFDVVTNYEAASELRRLHEENERLKAATPVQEPVKPSLWERYHEAQTTTPPAALVQLAWVWQQAPVKTQWGHDMVVADLAIDKDHTVSIYCELDQTSKVEAMFTPPAAPVQEPVAWMFQHEETGRTMCVDAKQVEWGFEKGNPRLKKIAPLYTSPQPSKQWVGLTDEEKADLFEGTAPYYNEVDYADAIEAKLREKNHG